MFLQLCYVHVFQRTEGVIQDVALVLSAISDRDRVAQPSSSQNPFDASTRARLVDDMTVQMEGSKPDVNLCHSSCMSKWLSLVIASLVPC